MLILQENTYAKLSFLIKLLARHRGLHHRCFPMNFGENFSFWRSLSSPEFTCSKSTIETPEQCVKYVQSQQQRHQNDVNEMSFWCHYWLCLDFIVMLKNSLIRKIRVISKFMTCKLVNKKLQYTYCPISHEVTATRKWNLVKMIL